jgi:hypothetical protein
MEFEPVSMGRHSRRFEGLNPQQHSYQNLKFRKVMSMLNCQVTKPYVCGGIYVIAHSHHPGRFILGESDPWVHRIGDQVWIGYKINPNNASN